MQSSQQGGMLTIKAVHGKLTRDLETFGKQDPYVKITYMGTPYKTRVHENGGKNPVWNQEFTFRIGSTSDDILVECKDDDTIGAKMIGKSTIKASAFCINNGVREYFTVTDNYGKSVGQILFETKYVPDNKPPVQGMMPTAVPVMVQPMMPAYPAPQAYPAQPYPGMAPPAYPS